MPSRKKTARPDAKPSKVAGRGWRPLHTWLLAVALLVAAAAVWFVASRVSQPGVRRVVLLSIDTLRADHVGAYDPARKTTPNIDRLAAEGVLFADVVTPVPMTLPAHCSMLTGTLPPRHGVRDNGGYTLAASHTTLAEVLRGAGFRTAGVVSSASVRGLAGLDQGFEAYQDDFGAQPGGREPRAERTCE